MKKTLLLSMLLCVSSSVFASNTVDGMADKVCQAKGATPMLQYKAKDMSVNAYSNDKGDIEYSLTFFKKYPKNPANNILQLSHTRNEIYQDLILNALDQNRDVYLCFSANGDIVSAKTTKTEKK